MIGAGLNLGGRHWRVLALGAAAAGGLVLAAASAPNPAHAAQTHAARGASGASLPLPPPMVAPPSAGTKAGGSAKTAPQGPAVGGTANGKGKGKGAAKSAATDTKALVAKALAKTEKRLAALHNSLGITDSEKKSWAAFAQVARDHAKALARMRARRAKDLPHMNAVQNIESYAAISAKQADDLNAMSAAFQTLYGKLTKSQQNTADQLFRQRAEQHSAIRLGTN